MWRKLDNFVHFVHFSQLPPPCTCAVADSFVLDDVLMLQRFQDLDLSLKVSYVFCSAVLEFLHGHDFSGVVLKRVIPTHLHAAKVTLKEEDQLK